MKNVQKIQNTYKNMKIYKKLQNKCKTYKINTQQIQNKYMQNILQILNMQGGSPPARQLSKFVECSACIYFVFILYFLCLFCSFFV